MVHMQEVSVVVQVMLWQILLPAASHRAAQIVWHTPANTCSSADRAILDGRIGKFFGQKINKGCQSAVSLMLK